MSSFKKELETGARFEFGENWERFLETLDERRITAAIDSLKGMLRMSDLTGKSFLDIGSGSGLSSLAAKRLGARVYSFDYDPRSVACTKELKRLYCPGDAEWVVEEGSALDEDYIAKLGKFDIVYSWGVLHHTGDMWKALSNAVYPIADGGIFFIAIYNDQGFTSKIWKEVKKTYCALPSVLKFLVLIPSFVRLWGPTLLRNGLSGSLFSKWNSYHKQRGMSPWRDVVDWVGGYPFEVAKTEEIISFFEDRGFEAVNLKSVDGGLGCNEYVFRKI